MKKIFCLMIAALIFTSENIPQDNEYWETAIPGERIYTVYFFDDAKVIAVSTDNEHFVSTNSGITWKFIGIKKISEISSEAQKLYIDIHCAVIHTTDGGKNWYPYSSEKHEHFCRVYLKDPNVGYDIAFEFLSKVTSEINHQLKSSSIESLNIHPQQCTEYYTNEIDGWALGWCVKNFVMKKSIKNSER